MPETESTVVDAPPFIENKPLVIVEEAFDTKPLWKVDNPDTVSEFKDRVPRYASME